jgi:biopolymer transport protein ExbD
MSLEVFMSGIAVEFSGKSFTTQDLMEFVMNQKLEVSSPKPKAKKAKKPKKEPKKIKMTIRHYIMTQETDVYKAKVTERVEENKQHNKEHEEEIETGDEDPRPENFLKVLKIVMDEMTDEEKQEIQEKVDKYNEEHNTDDSDTD